jgi:hypothetical protein
MEPVLNIRTQSAFARKIAGVIRWFLQLRLSQAKTALLASSIVAASKFSQAGSSQKALQRKVRNRPSDLTKANSTQTECD